MYNYSLHQQIDCILQQKKWDTSEPSNRLFYARLLANIFTIQKLYNELYSHHPTKEETFQKLIACLLDAHTQRSATLQKSDKAKEIQGNWFLSNEIVGMSLYVDRFSGNLKNLEKKLPYLHTLGVNFLHLMPLFQSPPNESDGGYAVSNFREVDSRFGTLEDLKKLKQKMAKAKMYLMLDIVLNHTSHHHKWAKRAKEGEAAYQEYYYMYDDRTIPDQFEQTMPEIFPESSPGNFSYSEECGKWVMTVFHDYQWDLNYTNPMVLVEMLENIFFYANLGVDILRIDAPAFIWKTLGTTCQNLPEAHTLLRLIKHCVAVATPGMALLGEAIVAPQEIIKYFGTDAFLAEECDFAYNATMMALQWDALATTDTSVMRNAQSLLAQKPFGTSWITYTRCHDDIGLGYDDWMISQAGFTPYLHRKFLMEYYAGIYEGSPAKGALFSVNPKTQDARISGTLASLCGLEKAIEENNASAIEISIQKILLMQAHSFFLGGIPMLFYGDEVGYTNDYAFLEDESKAYDNRWMHRPAIDWKKIDRAFEPNTIEAKIFQDTQKLIAIRKKIPSIFDYQNIQWLDLHNKHISCYVRWKNQQRFVGIFNFSPHRTLVEWNVLMAEEQIPHLLFDHWQNRLYKLDSEQEFLVLLPYQFMLLEG